MISIAVLDMAGHCYRRLDHQSELMGYEAVNAFDSRKEGGRINLDVVAAADFLVVVADPESEDRLSDAEVRLLKSACIAEKTEILLVSSLAVFPPAEAHLWHEDEPVAPGTEFGRYCVRLEEGFAHNRLTIIRTGWLFSLVDDTWYASVLTDLEKGIHVDMPSDYTGNPTSYDDLSRVILAVIRQLTCAEAPLLRGRYHYAGQEPVSLLRFFRIILSEASQFTSGISGTVESVLLIDWQKTRYLGPHSDTGSQKLLDTFGIKPRLWLKETVQQLKIRYSGKTQV